MLSVNGRSSLPSRATIKRAVAIAVVAGVGAGLPVIAATGASAAPLHQGGYGHHHGAGHAYTAPQAATHQQAPVQRTSAPAPAAPAAAAQATPAPAAAPAGYTVASGDWLSKIATTHNVQGGWQKLYDLNKSVLNQGPDVLYPGQHLVLGDAQAAAAPQAAPAPAAAAPAKQQSAPAAPSTSTSTQAAAPAAPAAAVTAPTDNSPGSLQALAASIVPADQLASFDQIITHESGWNVTATNPSSGAYGLPQALPGNKMASAGSDWATNPATQLKWALQYMNTTYGSPNQAWAFWQTHSAY
ncbi:LysM peptidoglycan-binding domain-containing protein [Kitasatospora sp. NBC_01287]|uniref:LysM peptidoglycan-binding domain-containing protein n=1 Tax=Kitasatospora sp. NBC_01287 TaxID=2903573 RepID=UPI00224F9F33|nr:LysM peptidoglycan-binding domain-containing protein [Kitasatospora sp. NBC_01287]MCX4744564.1 LysM peptidoglycan-binding domain-containing protein [Kitasatospora sp. NBC_01287]